MKDVSIVIVGTNEKADVMRCLPSIENSRTSFSIETILVDNASTDGTGQAVIERFKNVRIIRTDRRMGYIENNLLGMREACGRYVLLLNADIDLKPDTLQYAVEFMDAHPEAAVSSCKLLFDDGTLQLTCRRFPTPLVYLARLPHFLRWIRWAKRFSKNRVVDRYLMADYDHQKTKAVDWVLSAFFLLRREALEDIGPVGRGLLQPFYLEDVDWCFRAWVRGWKVYYLAEVEAFHFYKRGSVSRFGKLSLVHLGNIVIFFAKNGWAMLLGRHKRHAR
ncbi:MAG: glycosyltransferase family 2 protein [Candidatus Omnitrophota bacterium]